MSIDFNQHSVPRKVRKDKGCLREGNRFFHVGKVYVGGTQFMAWSVAQSLEAAGHDRSLYVIEKGRMFSSKKKRWELARVAADGRWLLGMLRTDSDSWAVHEISREEFLDSLPHIPPPRPY